MGCVLQFIRRAAIGQQGQGNGTARGCEGEQDDGGGRQDAHENPLERQLNWCVGHWMQALWAPVACQSVNQARDP
ncbi:hypothetical protein GCM10011587_05440 [Pyruvatibacter mobilis]|nr:hypothetical protein GCM10011587_05440 [Pyruvatibacter mobilis]